MSNRSRRIALALLCLAASSCSYRPAYSARTLSGERFSSESLKGSVVLVQFWTTWCHYCRGDQPAVDALARQFYNQGLMVLAVNVGEPKEKVREYLSHSPRSCRVVTSEDTDLVDVLGGHSFPYYVLIDRDGRVAGDQHGAGGEEALRRLLTRAGIGDPR